MISLLIVLCFVAVVQPNLIDDLEPEIKWKFQFGTASDLFDPIPLIHFPGSCNRLFGAAKIPGENAVLIYGGRFNDGSTNSVDGMGLLWKYLLDESRYVNLWREPGPTDFSLPADMQGHAMVMLDNETFVLFGGEEFQAVSGSSNLLWKCNIATRDSCIKLSGVDYVNPALDSTTPTPPGIAYHSMVYNRKRDSLFVFGGYTSASSAPGCFNDIWQYDLGSEKWTLLSGDESTGSTSMEQPGSLCFHSMAQDEEQDRIYIYGGSFSLPLDLPKKELWRYDIENGVWKKRLDAPYGLAQTSMVYHRRSLVLYGGFISGSSVPQSWNGFMVYDIESEHWQVVNVKTLSDVMVSSDFTSLENYRLESIRYHFMTMNDEEDTFYLFGGVLWDDDIETCNSNTWKFSYVPEISETTVETILEDSTTLEYSTTVISDTTTVQTATSIIETTDEIDYFSQFDTIVLELSLEEQHIEACTELNCDGNPPQYQLFPFLNCIDHIEDTFIAYFGYVNTRPNASPRIAENFITLSETCLYPSPATKFTFDIRNFFFSINFTDSVQWNLNGSSIDIFDDDFSISQCPDYILTQITLTNYAPRAITYISTFLVDFLKIDSKDLTISLLQSEKRQEEIILIADVQITDPEAKQEIVSDLSLLSEYPEPLESHIVLSSIDDGGVLIGISEIRVLPTNVEIYSGNTYPVEEIESDSKGISDAVIVSIVAGSAVVVSAGIITVLFSQDSVRSFICKTGI